MQDPLRAEASHHLVSQQPSVRVSPLSSPVEDEGQVGQARRLARQQVKLQLPALPHEVRLQELDEEALAQRPMRSSQEECRRRKSDVEIARNEERDQRTENGFERVPPRKQTAVDDNQSTSNKFLKHLNSNFSSNKLFENERIKKCIFCASLTVVRQEIAQDSKNKVSK